MAKTIDQRVVEMQFNNANFEKNVGTTMSTLDRLKEKLNFKGAVKGLDDLNSSVKNCDMSPLEKAIDTVHVKFSAWEVMAVTALTRITNAAIDAGKQLVKSLSTDNIEAGWQKFADKTVAVGTLHAQGYEMEEINKQLEMLNWFTDETSYNFNDMVSEIGKFTAAGQDLDDSVAAMEGIATWAALSGQNAATASRAMYQLSQAMGSGIMRKEDWKSIQNANMDTKEFRQTALDTAVALGTLQKVGEDSYQSIVEGAKGNIFTIEQFADNLTQELWFTSEVMMSVYKNYGKASKILQTYVDANELDTASEGIEAIEAAAESYMETMEGFGEEGFDKVAAMDEALKHVSLEAMKEIPEVVEEAKAWIVDYNNSIDEAVNEEAKKLADNEALKEFMEAYNAGLEENEPKLTSLESAKAKLQEYINDLAGSKIAAEDVDTALEKMGYTIDSLSIKAFKAGQEARTWEDVINSVKDAVSSGWSDTFEQIFGDYEQASKLWTGLANDLWDIFAAGGKDRVDMLKEWNAIGTEEGDTRSTARDLLFSRDEEHLGALWKILRSIKKIIDTVKGAFQDMFPPMTAKKLYDFTQGFADLVDKVTGFIDSITGVDMEETLRNKLPTGAFDAFSKSVGTVNEKAGTLRRTLRGAFAIFGIIADFLKAGFGEALKFITSLFGEANGNIFDLTANVGDNIVAFRKWLQDSGTFQKIFETIFNVLRNGIDVVKWFVQASHIGDFIRNAIGLIGKLAGAIGDLISRLMNGENFGDIIADMFKDIHPIEAAKDAFTDAKKGVKDFFDGLSESSAIFKGIKDFFKDVPKFLKDCFDGIVSVLSNANIDLDACFSAIKHTFENLTVEDIITAGVIIGIVLVIKSLLSITDSVNTIAGSFEKLTGTIKKFFGNIKKALHANTLLVMAGAILMLCGALITLSEQNPDQLWNAVKVVGALAGGLTVMLLVFSKMSDFGPATIAVLGLAGSIALLGVAIGILANTETGDLKKVAGVLLAVTAYMVVVMTLLSWVVNKKGTIDSLGGVALMMVGFGLSMLLMVGALKQLANLGDVNLDGAINTMLKLMTLMTVVTAVSSYSKGSGAAIMALGFALYMILGFIKLFNLIDPLEAFRGIAAIEDIFNKFGEALFLAHGLPFTEAKGLGGSFIGLAAALFIIAEVLKKFGEMDLEVLKRGGAAIGQIMIFFAIISAVAGLTADKATISSKLSGKIFKKTAETEKNYTQVSKSMKAIGNLLIKVAAAIGILALVMKYLTTLPNDQNQVVGATIIVGLFLALITAIIYACTQAKDIDTKALNIILGAIIVLSVVLAALTVAKPENALSAGGAMLMALAGLAAFVGLLAVVVSQANKSGVFTAKIMDRVMLSIMAAIVALGGVFWALSVLDVRNVFENSAGLTLALIGLASSLAILSVLSNTYTEDKFKNLHSLVGALLELSLALVPIGFALGMMSALHTNGAVENAKALGLILIALGGAIAISTVSKSLNGDRLKAVSYGFVMLSGVVAILAGVLAGLNALKVKDQMGNVLALSVLLAAMTGVFFVLNLFTVVNTGAIEAMFALSAIVAILGLVLAEMNGLQVKDQMDNVLALSVLLGAMSVSLILLNFVTPLAGAAMGSMFALTAVVAILGLVLAEMNGLQVKDQMDNVLALSVLLGAMSVSLILLNFVTPLAGLAMGSMFALTAVVAILGLVLAEMNGLGVHDAMPNVQALSLLLLAMSGALVILNFVTPLAGLAMGSMFALTGVVALLGLILGMMEGLGVQNAMPNTEALSTLLMSMTQALLLLNFVGPLAGAGVLVLYLMTGVVAILAQIMGSMIEMKVNEAMPNAEALIFMLDNITNIMIKLLPVGILAPFAIASIVALVAFVKAVFGMTTALGALITAFPMLEEFVDKGIPLLEKLGYGVGAFLGSIVGGFASGVASGLPDIGGNLGEALGRFYEGFSKVDEPSKIGDGADALMKLFEAAKNIPDAKDIKDPTVFAQSMFDLGSALGDFYKGIGDIQDISKVDTAVEAIGKLSEFSKSLPDMSSDQASTTLENFSTGVGHLADALVYFNNTITEDAAHGGVSKINTKAIEDAATAGQALSSLANSLPERGGVLQDWLGEKDTLSNFAAELPSFGEYMVSFAETVENLDIKVVTNAAAAGSTMAELANKLPSHGGGLQLLMGEQDSLATFGANLKQFGTDIYAFSQEVLYLNTGNVEKAKTAGLMMAELDSKLTSHGGVVSWFTGDNDLKSFGEKLPWLGEGIAAFSQVVSGGKAKLSDGTEIQGYKLNTDSMDVASNALQVLSTVESTLPEKPGCFSWLTGGGTDIDGFVKNMPKLGEGIVSFSKSIDDNGGINATSVSAAAEALGSIAAISQVQDFSKVSTITEMLPSIGENLKKYSNKLFEGKAFDTTSVKNATDAIFKIASLETELKISEYKKTPAAFDLFNKLTTTLGQVSALDIDKITAFGEAVKGLADTQILTFFNSFSDNSDSVKQYALDLLNSLVNGIETNDTKTKFKNSFTAIAEEGLSAIKEKSADYKAAGAQITNDIIEGMKGAGNDENTGLQAEYTSMMEGAFGGNNSTNILSNIMGGNGLDASSITDKLTGMLNGGDMSTLMSGADMSGFENTLTSTFNGSLTDAASNIDVSSIMTGGDTGSGGMYGAFEDYFSGEDAQAMFSGLGGDMSNGIFSFFSTDNADFKMDTDEAIGSMVSALNTSSETKKEDIEGSGKKIAGYMIDGWQKGITERKSDIEKTAGDIANWAKDEMQLILEIHSPSKVTQRIGDYFVQGFVNALTDSVTSVTSASSQLAQSATDGMQKALAESAALFDTTAEIQPTITPVIDLSNVRDGVYKINSMIDTPTRSVSMARDIRYGFDLRALDDPNRFIIDNRDVVESIRGLRNDMGAMTEAITNTQMVLDTGVLVGEMAAPMDKSLGIRATIRKRG